MFKSGTKYLKVVLSGTETSSVFPKHFSQGFSQVFHFLAKMFEQTAVSLQLLNNLLLTPPVMHFHGWALWTNRWDYRLKNSTVELHCIFCSEIIKKKRQQLCWTVTCLQTLTNHRAGSRIIKILLCAQWTINLSLSWQLSRKLDPQCHNYKHNAMQT